MNLNELIPERVSWKPQVKIDGQPDYELELFFRPFTIEDEAKLKRMYPENRLQEVFEKLETTEIVRIAYHQLEPSSKQKLMLIKFKDFDEKGDEIEVAPTGPEKIGCLVKGVGEIIGLIDNILKTRGLSLPLLEKIVKEVGTDGLAKLAHAKK